MHLVGSANETANIFFPGHPFRMAVAKDDIPAVCAMVVACIRKISVWTVRATDIVGIVDNPHVR